MIVQWLIASYSWAVASVFNTNAVDFDGSTEYMANTGASFAFWANTIEIWIKPTVVWSGSDFYTFFNFANSSNQAMMYAAFYQWQFYNIYGVGGTAWILQAGTPSNGNIYHIVLSHNGTNAMKMYINWTDTWTATWVGSLSWTVTQVFMWKHVSGSNTNWVIACASYWNTNLSQTEITALYDSGNWYKNDKRVAKWNYTSTGNLIQQWVPGKDWTDITTMGQSYVSSWWVNIGTNASNISSADIVTF